MSRPCAKNNPCPRGYICSKEEKVCLKRYKAKKIRVSDVAKELDEIPKTKPAWKEEQGDLGFNKWVRGKLRKHVEDAMTCNRDGRRQSHQNVVKELVAPHTTVRRMLLAHQLGTGKTFSMLSILENFYHTPDPILLFFPKQSLVVNFYRELLKFPSKFRAYVHRELKPPPRDSEGNDVIDRKYLAACVDLLEKKNRVRAGVVLAPKKGEPAAPLRAFTFADGGAPGFHEQRAAPLFKIARALEGKSTTKDAEMFNRCVVMVDEAHLLAKPSANSELNQQQLGAVARLAKRLTTASPRLVLATATPVIDEAKDADALMAIVHGTAPHRADEGFVSWFMSRPPSLFATSTPSANMIPHVVKVPLQGENLLTYKRELLAKTPKEKLQKYENSILFYYNDKAIDNLRAQLRLKHGAGASLASKGASVASKLHRIAMDIKDGKSKTAILMHRRNGAQVLHAMLEAHGVKAGIMFLEENNKEAAKRVDDVRNAFNAPDNARGEKMQALVLDSRDYSEGVSLLNVRELILADLSPYLIDKGGQPSWGRMKQRIGRALRMCSHASLRPDERTLKLSLYVATYPEDATPTQDERKLQYVTAQQIEVERAMCRLEAQSMDQNLYGPSDCVRSGQLPPPPPAPKSAKLLRTGKHKSSAADGDARYWKFLTDVIDKTVRNIDPADLSGRFNSPVKLASAITTMLLKDNVDLSGGWKQRVQVHVRRQWGRL